MLEYELVKQQRKVDFISLSKIPETEVINRLSWDFDDYRFSLLTRVAPTCVSSVFWKMISLSVHPLTPEIERKLFILRDD